MSNSLNLLFNPNHNRAFFRRVLAFLSSFLLLVSMGCSADSGAEKAKSPKMQDVKESVHYTKVNIEKDLVGPKDRVKVVEFFSYGCPHCAHLEPGLKKWLVDQPSFVEFEHVPAFWNESFERLAQTYFALELMKKESELRGAIFNALHKRKMRWGSDSDVAAFVEEQGVDGEKFKKTINSFAVQQKLKMADRSFREYRLKSVPTFVVAGQYVTSVAQAGSEEQLWRTLNYLTAQVKAGKL